MRLSEITRVFDDGSSYDRNDPVAVTFMEGGCYALALALNKRFGWPLYVMGVEEDENVEDSHFHHCVVKHPSGSFIDVCGPQTPQELEQIWGDPLAPISPDVLLRSLNDYARNLTLKTLPEAARVIDTYMKPRWPEIFRT